MSNTTVAAPRNNAAIPTFVDAKDWPKKVNSVDPVAPRYASQIAAHRKPKGQCRRREQLLAEPSPSLLSIEPLSFSSYMMPSGTTMYIWFPDKNPNNAGFAA